MQQQNPTDDDYTSLSGWKTEHRSSCSGPEGYEEFDPVNLKTPFVTSQKSIETSTGIAVPFPNIIQRLRDRMKLLIPGDWRFGTILALIFSFIVLITNFVILMLAAQKRKGNSLIVSLHKGDCDAMNRMGNNAHIAINIVSTILLGCSNFVMQWISAPTREDVDAAHAEGSWLDIGILSVRNLVSFDYSRKVCWLLLCVSSLPLHLVYNSVVFMSTTNYLYNVFIVNDSFENGGYIDPNLYHNRNFTLQREHWYDSEYARYSVTATWPNWVDPADIQRALTNGVSNASLHSFERLERDDCIKAYSKKILSDHRNIILVSSSSPQSNDQLHQSIHTGYWGSISSNISESTSYAAWSCDTAMGAYNSTDEFNSISCHANSSAYAVMQYTKPLLAESIPVYNNWYNWICSQLPKYYDYIGVHDNGTLVSPEFLRPPQPRGSICSEGYWQTISQQDTWAVYGFEIDYCLSEKTEEQCSLDLALHLLLIVVIFNFVKVTVMAITLSLKQERKLLTIGDAITSFVTDELPKGSHGCLLTENDVKSHWGRFKRASRRVASSEDFERPFVRRKLRRFQAVSKIRWVIASTLTFMAISAIMGLLAYAVIMLRYDDRADLSSLWAMGIGDINPWNIITVWRLPMRGENSVLGMAMMSNLAQVLMSVLYVFINGLLTSMSLAEEWSQHSYRWRTLRVAGLPRTGQQRSEYFLQLPYRFGIPLLIFSAFMHWVISRAIFMVKLSTRSATGEPVDFTWEGPNGYTITTCGFSPVAMCMAAIGIASLFAFVAIVGLRELEQNGMPLVGSCSLAIAASCQVPPGTSASLPLMWGDVSRPFGQVATAEFEGEDGEIVGHCSFANENVDVPVVGRLYR